MENEDRESLRRKYLSHAETAEGEARKSTDRYIREGWQRIADQFRQKAEEVK